MRQLFIAFFLSLTIAGCRGDSLQNIEGTYLCQVCAGYMVINKGKNNYSSSISVGHGSCGGEIFYSGKLRGDLSGRLKFPLVWHEKKCHGFISFSSDGAVIEDDCKHTWADSHSTCSVLGSYKKK